MAADPSVACSLEFLAIRALASVLQRPSPCQDDFYAEPPGFHSMS
jgi:hypothetical protein